MRPMHFILPALAALAMSALTPTIGHADPYKWCAQYGLNSDLGRNCGFVTYEQCMATVRGIGGICEPNPFYTGPERRRPVRKRQPD